MDTLHLNTYLHLIEALLQCAKGEEWLLLKQHEQLIDAELIGVMEQVTEQLNTEGNLPAAKFLRYWTAQLNDLLQQNQNTATETSAENRSPSYLNLIQTILDCDKGDEVAILSQHPDLVDPGLVDAMNQVAAQLAAQGNQDIAIYLKHLAAEVNRVLLHSESSNSYVNSPASQAAAIASKLPHHERESSSVQAAPPTVVANPPTTSSGQNNNHANGSIDPTVEITKQPLPDLASKPTAAPQHSNQIEELLANISSRLEQLETSINKHQNPSNPLWYMSILEQADAQGWIVSSDEVEQLIGTKPHCAPDSNSFVRGCWKFEKAGKVGMQSSWRVTKEIPAPSIVGVGLSSDTATAVSNGRLTPVGTKLELDLASPWAEK
jgi:hypothetical protein